MPVYRRNEEQLAELKLNYDLLINELFHLLEFTSLVEFDPCFRNSSDSFYHFISTNGLGLNQTEEQDKNDTSASRRIRRRNIRGKPAPDDDILEKISPLVDEKYEELKLQLSDNKSKKAIEVKHEVVQKKRKISKPKTVVKKQVKKEESPKPLPEIETDDVIGQKEEINSNNEDDSFYFTTSSEEESEDERPRKRKFPRLHLFVRPPRQTVTNPLHVVKSKYPSLSNFLESYKSLDEDISIEEYNRYISEQRTVFSKIRNGLENGALKYDSELDSLLPITVKDAMTSQPNRPEAITYFYKEQKNHTFQDHLINQGVVMSKIFQDSRRARVSRARRVSQMIEQHFKHIAGAEERKHKEEERKRKALARMAIQAVKKRWVMAEKAIRVLKKDEEDQLKRIMGKEHLSKMLEQSTQLLGAQLNQLADSDDEQDEDGENTDTSDGHDTDNNSDDTLTSSSSSFEEESETENENDTNLTVEELRAKYSDIPDFNENNGQLHKDNLEAEKRMSSGDLEISEVEKKELENNLNDNSNKILDEDESSSDYMSDTSSANSSEEDNESGITSEDDGKPSGLASLFTGTEDYDSEDESDYSNPSQSEEKGQELAERKDQNGNSHVVEIEPSPTNIEPETISDNEKPSGDNDPVSVVDVPLPSLLRGTLRSYQKQGLNWLASLYNNNTNGILADEMGLGKTIQTISLLAYLACEKQNWGPHLIIVPTSVLLNWEMEFKRFAPGFKVLTYYGSPQQRKEKRKGWNKPDAFHVCITSYQLVVHDQHSFKRKKWQYMILDEAHNIKNFRSTRWQALLNFNTERRLLLTGTPLQNNLAELWSLLYFLMPQTAVGNNGGIQGFADLDAFQQWFGRPVDKIIETGEGYEQDDETRKTVTKLHQVLRPYLLRRLKADVEKQMPAKYEHIVYCRLSKRQRFLYDDFMSRAQTKATLASGNFMSIINCLMQLRKVCNHPDLFEVRPILTSFCIENCVLNSYKDLNAFIVRKLHQDDHENLINLNTLNLRFTDNERLLTSHYSESTSRLKCIDEFVGQIRKLREETNLKTTEECINSPMNFQNISEFYKSFLGKKSQRLIDHFDFLKYLNSLRCDKKPVYGKNVIELLTLGTKKFISSEFFKEANKPLDTRLVTYRDEIEKFAVVTPNVVTLDNREFTLGLNDEAVIDPSTKRRLRDQLTHLDNPFHQLQTKLSIAFPDKSLLQYDCGKLQKLAQILQDLKDNGHRALIFTQMTKVLDILEQFLNYHGYLYMRLDGATKIEDRQILTERFNSDPRITVFILSSRSGGLGINLTGADTVIFYDSDWNPAMDKQCQDRCHRIGQTRDVHIYRFVSEHTIESNILKKANQKRHLDNVVIQKGDFTTDYFTKLSVKDLLGAEAPEGLKDNKPLLLENADVSKDPRKLEKLLAEAEDEDDVKAANLAMKEVEVDVDDFRESSTNPNDTEEAAAFEDEYEGTKHVEEYMLRFIANGYYYD